MVFTEKERQIINALLEEEIDCTVRYGKSIDEVITNYSQSLESILKKVNEKAFRAPMNRYASFMSRRFADKQLA